MQLNISLPEIVIQHPVTEAILATLPAQSLTEVQLTLTDSEARTINGRTIQPARVAVMLRPIPHRPLVLWEGAEVRSDYTSADVEARIVELLGSDPTAVLTALIKPPALATR